jgi:hypothetical protein
MNVATNVCQLARDIVAIGQHNIPLVHFLSNRAQVTKDGYEFAPRTDSTVPLFQMKKITLIIVSLAPAPILNSPIPGTDDKHFAIR